MKLRRNEYRYRTEWVDKAQQEKRNEFYAKVANLGSWAPMARWKDTCQEDMIYYAGKKVKEINNIKDENYQQTVKNAFNKQAKAAGWELDFDNMKQGVEKYIKDMLRKMPEKTMEERRTIYDFITNFDYNSVKMDGAGKPALKL